MAGLEDKYEEPAVRFLPVDCSSVESDLLPLTAGLETFRAVSLAAMLAGPNSGAANLLPLTAASLRRGEEALMPDGAGAKTNTSPPKTLGLTNLIKYSILFSANERSLE